MLHFSICSSNSVHMFSSVGMRPSGIHLSDGLSIPNCILYMNLFYRCSVCGSDNHPGATCYAGSTSSACYYSPKRQPTGAEVHLKNALYMHGVSCTYFTSNPHLAKGGIFLKVCKESFRKFVYRIGHNGIEVMKLCRIL